MDNRVCAKSWSLNHGTISCEPKIFSLVLCGIGEETNSREAGSLIGNPSKTGTRKLAGKL